jgi:hypothetical protein
LKQLHQDNRMFAGCYQQRPSEVSLIPEDNHSAFGLLPVPAGTEIPDWERQEEIIAESIALDVLEKLFPEGLTEEQSAAIHSRAKARMQELLNQTD